MIAQGRCHVKSTEDHYSMPPPVSRQTKHHTFIDGGSVAHTQLGLMTKKTASNWILKSREIDWSYLCLQKFDKF